MPEPETQSAVTTVSAEGTQGNLQTDAKFNVNVGAKFTILRTNLAAALQKTGDKWQVLVAPTDAVANQGMTINEIVSEIMHLMGDNKESVQGLNDQLESAVKSMVSEENQGGFQPESIKLYLRQVFVYYEKEGDKSGAEYAFSLEVDTSKMLKNIGMFNLEGIVFAVWNTKRRKVKERMSMFDIDEYLRELT